MQISSQISNRLIRFIFSADDDDDDDFMGGNFEMELANMEREVEDLLGDGPENQHTNHKWVCIVAYE